MVTEAFVKLYHSSQVFSSEGGVKGWLRVTVRNAALRLLEQNDRQRNRLNDFSSMLHDVETQWYQEDVLAGVFTLLYQEIETLPAKSREVFKLRYIEHGKFYSSFEFLLNLSSLKYHLVVICFTLRAFFKEKLFLRVIFVVCACFS